MTYVPSQLQTDSLSALVANDDYAGMYSEVYAITAKPTKLDRTARPMLALSVHSLAL